MSSKEWHENYRERKNELQRIRRAILKEQGDDSYKKKRLSDEVKEENKIIRKERQRAWFLTEEGISFKQRQAERRRLFSSTKERDFVRNERRKHLLKTNLDSCLRQKASACRSRAKKLGIPCDIDFNYLKSIYTEYCPYLGIKLNLMATSGNSMDGLSIDKIIPELGYTKGNVRIISYKANVMKQDVSIETLIKFANSVLEIHGDA